jgi:hypothetical protein
MVTFMLGIVLVAVVFGVHRTGASAPKPAAAASKPAR